LDVSADELMGTATKFAAGERHFSPALSSSAAREHLSRFHLPGIPKMYERCLVCDVKFDREPGYVLGTMYPSYGLGLVIVASIAAALCSVTDRWITKDTIWAVVLFLPLAPTITLSARVPGFISIRPLTRSGVFCRNPSLFFPRHL
jgi:hypothetical protein